MGSGKKVIVKKISVRSTSYNMDKDDVLISVLDGEISDILRGAGKREIDHTDGTLWYAVDGSEHQFDMNYSGGDINFSFSFLANASCPTLLIYKKELVGKDMPEVVLNWAAKASVSNTIADFLSGRGIKTENQLFSGNNCDLLEAELLKVYQEHFIKEWGMFLNSVAIKRKIAVSASTKVNKSIYDYIL